MNSFFANDVLNRIKQIMSTQNIMNTPFSGVTVAKIREDILSIANAIEQEDNLLSFQLKAAKDNLFWSDNIGRSFIHPIVAGKIIFGLEYLVNKQQNQANDIWALIHPRIIKSSKKLYLDGSYTNAATDAFIEINERLKKLFMIISPGTSVLDGVALMNKMFSPNAPMLQLCDISTQTGEDKQKGLMMMSAGAILGLRNPKSHANSEIITKEEAMRRLMFASTLMYQIDEAVIYSNIAE